MNDSIFTDIYIYILYFSFFLPLLWKNFFDFYCEINKSFEISFFFTLFWLTYSKAIRTKWSLMIMIYLITTRFETET